MDVSYYDGEHSLKIGNADGDGVWKDSWVDFHLIPSSRPVITPPEVVTNYKDVPGRNGKLDFTELLDGVKYANRTGSIEFIVDYNQNSSWAEAYSEVMNYLHGKSMSLVLADDPTHFYQGRFAVDTYASSEHWSTITIKYNLLPFRYLLANSQTMAPMVTKDYEWLWNDLFMNNIFYGSFKLPKSGSVVRKLVSNGSIPVYATFTSNVACHVYYNNKTISFKANTPTQLNFLPITSKGVTLSFYNDSASDGTATISYNLGVSL